MTRALPGRLRTAVAQSVGAGCCEAGTPATHRRHIPGGGWYPLGTSPPSPPGSPWARAGGAPAGAPWATAA